VDVICVPGGFGVDAAMQDTELLDFVRRQANQARFVTSVCTGAFILGAAGLLKGKRATTHWAYHAELARMGAIPTQGRIVQDGNLITGGGVTAGIDFGLAVLAEIAGRDTAEAVQLTLEYDPAPPFGAGSPDAAPPAALAAARTRYETRLVAFRAALDRAMAGSI
jgi:cyclohexyl-isocyanide hydratase